MEPTDDGSRSGILSPDDTFAVLGNESRISILQTLGEADGPLRFSELRNRVGHDDPGNFQYHLDKLVGHFVRKFEDGYGLRQAGRRVVEAIYSGIITEDPPTERFETDHACWQCGAPIEIRLRPGRVESLCTKCPGDYGETSSEGRSTSAERGYLGGLTLPPAGFQGRTPEEVYRVAHIWGYLEWAFVTRDVCPRCSASLDHDVRVCTDHSLANGLCGSCNHREEVVFVWHCTNCIFRLEAGGYELLSSHSDVMSVITANGYDPFRRGDEFPDTDVTCDVRSTDPFLARYTYSFEGDELVLAVDEELNVELVSRDVSSDAV